MSCVDVDIVCVCVFVCVFVWQTGNGDSSQSVVLMDVNGIYGVDRKYEGADYNSRCDYAAPKGKQSPAADVCVAVLVGRHGTVPCWIPV